MKMCTNNNYMQVRSARWIPTQIYLCSLFLSVFCVVSQHEQQINRLYICSEHRCAWDS